MNCWAINLFFVCPVQCSVSPMLRRNVILSPLLNKSLQMLGQEHLVFAALDKLNIYLSFVKSLVYQDLFSSLLSRQLFLLKLYSNLFNLETGNPFKENTEQNFSNSKTYLLLNILRESATDVHYRKEWKVSVWENARNILYKSTLAVGTGRTLRICLLYRKAEWNVSKYSVMSSNLYLCVFAAIHL